MISIMTMPKIKASYCAEIYAVKIVCTSTKREYHARCIRAEKLNKPEIHVAFAMKSVRARRLSNDGNCITQEAHKIHNRPIDVICYCRNVALATKYNAMPEIKHTKQSSVLAVQCADFEIHTPRSLTRLFPSTPSPTPSSPHHQRSVVHRHRHVSLFICDARAR